MDVTVQVDSRALQHSFRRAPIVVKAKLQNWVDRTSAIAERHAKTKEVPVVKGQLQNSIHMTVKPLEGIVKPNTEYMYWVHDGAKSPHAPARLKGSSYRGNPFMTRTHDRVKPQAEREGQKILNEIVRDL